MKRVIEGEKICVSSAFINMGIIKWEMNKPNRGDFPIDVSLKEGTENI